MATLPRLAQLLYRSQAKVPFTTDELQRLAERAREENERESLTGLLIYDDGRFFQFLEGPDDNLQRVWAKIRRDPRHHAVERLPVPPLPERLFPDWRLQLGVPNAEGIADALSLPAEALLELRERGRDAREILQGIAFQSRLPEPAALAVLLARGDEAQISALRDRVASMTPDWPTLGMHVLGPLARALGDAWRDDRLGAADLVIAQARLQSLLRQAASRTFGGAAQGHAGQVLVAPLQGETDLAGVTFASIAFDAAGWAVQCAFPKSTAELTASVNGPIDVLHLAVSDAFTREHRMAELAGTIRAARRAAVNPHMLVLLSGRAFVEHPGIATVLGADGVGLAQGSRLQDIETMLAWARIRWSSPATIIAQAALHSVCLQIQRKRFGEAKEYAQ